MSRKVTAVVVSHDNGEYLKQTLKALGQQSVTPDSIVVVDTSGQTLEWVTETVTKQHGLETIDLGKNRPLSAALRAPFELGQVTADPEHWLWLLHDDSAPEPNCLKELLLAEERNALAAVIGPKQVTWNDPRTIFQLGLTLSPGGTPLSPHANELDQSQHDSLTDVMAVGTAGALIRTDVLADLGGLSDVAPPLAADYDLSLRVKLAGYRVIVAPKARIRHAGLALAGKRPRRWLGGSPKTAVRKAAIHLRFAFEPLWLAAVYWLFLPLITVTRVFWRLFQKRPDRIGAELAAGLWGFFTVVARMRGRTGAKASNIREIRKAFNASWAQVRSSNLSRNELEDAAQMQQAFERGEHELAASETGKTFTEDRGWLWVFALLAASWAYFPTGVAAVGGGSLPLASDWFEVFARAGASWQPIGQGFIAPSDPFNWVLLALASITAWVPSLSIAVLLFVAPALAFASAYRVATLLTPKTWMRTVFGLGYALWPALVAARSEARIPAVVALVLLPWLVFAIARAAGLGRSGSARSMRQTWSWVGVAGLLMALVGASSPVLLVALLVGLAVVAFTRIRRFGYLFWIPLPVAALFTPLAWRLAVGEANPLALLTDPGIPQPDAVAGATPLELLFQPSILGLVYLAIPVLALFALLTKRWVLAGALTLFAAGLLAFASVHASLQFANPFGEPDRQWLGGSPSVLLGAFALVCLALLALLVEHSAVWVRRTVAIVVVLGVLAPMGFVAATTAREYQLRDDRVTPWLLSAQSQTENTQLLVIESSFGGYVARWVAISGSQLEDANVVYRYALAGLNANASSYGELASLVADLVSANGTNLTGSLSDSHVAYVLVPNTQTSANNDLANALDSVAELDSAGLTDFGRLWRVNVEVTPAPDDAKSPWSITKLVQLSILLAFVLLAIPSGAAQRRKSKPTEIFIDSDGDVA